MEVSPVVLASASPRRQALLALLGKPFRVLPTSMDETVSPGASAEATVISLALAKARIAAAKAPTSFVLAADTLVELEGRIIGKPMDAGEAVEMLRSLRGRWHAVWTGVALVLGASGYQDVRSVAASVLMRTYSDAEIVAYVATGDPMDKAAAYAVQHAAFDPVARLRGCRANVMGLPICEVHGMLASAAILDSVAPVMRCSVMLGITCPGHLGSEPCDAGTS
jgi:septum formation protein